MKWITRERPKIDRIACPWLIQRFIDPNPEFLFVPADHVLIGAERLGAIPFDIPAVELSHDGPRCSFDAFLKRYQLSDPALHALADIVRAADTDNLADSAQAAGLLAISLGLSANIKDDHQLLAAGFVIYDALYSWCRSGQHERHHWQAGTPTRTAGARP
ncbi:chromate resistance protein [Permianibacter sp. IMCC34836]|uniref:chromate resistance protein ChrB domain-containing protein n=1 Tax=Permianibacter fluminis TaxID=2738515 RepID=UPI0015562606|nr:chromate resistance protein ChrB domain-containing protein [Permianibacter fluminis]NQD35845.1 chromate resistance protein [Permianibacter fluminis]